MHVDGAHTTSLSTPENVRTPVLRAQFTIDPLPPLRKKFTFRCRFLRFARSFGTDTYTLHQAFLSRRRRNHRFSALESRALRETSLSLFTTYPPSSRFLAFPHVLR